MRSVALPLASILAVLFACQSQPAAQSGAGSPTPGAKAPGTPNPAVPNATAGAPTPAARDYTVRIVPGEATAGQPGQSIVEVTPAPGMHMNLDFPSRLKLTPAEGVTTPKAELVKADAELTEQTLRFPVGFTAARAGTFPMAALADFSVCNDQTCKLIRDEKLSWDLAVK